MERNASDAPIWTATSLTEAAFGLAAKGQFLAVSGSDLRFVHAVGLGHAQLVHLERRVELGQQRRHHDHGSCGCGDGAFKKMLVWPLLEKRLRNASTVLPSRLPRVMAWI